MKKGAKESIDVLAVKIKKKIQRFFSKSYLIKGQLFQSSKIILLRSNVKVIVKATKPQKQKKISFKNKKNKVS